MDKRLLQTYAVWAKDNLEQQIEVSLKTLVLHFRRLTFIRNNTIKVQSKLSIFFSVF